MTKSKLMNLGSLITASSNQAKIWDKCSVQNRPHLNIYTPKGEGFHHRLSYPSKNDTSLHHSPHSEPFKQDYHLLWYRTRIQGFLLLFSPPLHQHFLYQPAAVWPEKHRVRERMSDQKRCRIQMVGLPEQPVLSRHLIWPNSSKLRQFLLQK